MHDKQQIEKSLKRFLKKKLAYTTALLITFLITGSLATATGATPGGATPGGTAATPFGEGGSGVVGSGILQDELLAKIAAQKAEIEALIAANEAELKALEMNELDLLRQGDWYSKPWYPSYFGSLLVSWRNAKTGGDDWDYGIRTNTNMDEKREAFNAAAYEGGEDTDLQRAIDHTESRRKGSSGWLTATEGWNANTHTYDYEDTLMLLPVAKAPEIEEPATPAVSFTVPTAPVVVPVSSPQVVNISVGGIAVATPTISAPALTPLTGITAPSLSSISIDEPNFNVNIDPITVTGPGAMTVPTLVTPTINVTLSPAVPPVIVPPDPQVATPVPPQAPTFTSYVAPGGSWINGHGSGTSNGNNRGINNFNANVLTANTVAVASLGEAANLANGNVRRMTDPAYPLFASMDLEGAGGGRGKIWATRTDATTATTGYSNVASSMSLPALTNEYYINANGGVWIPIPTTVARPAYTAGTALNNSINGQKNRWLVTVAKKAGNALTTIERIDFELGGPDGTPATPAPAGEAAKTGESGVLLMRNDGDLLLNNVTIKLLGRTTILRDVLHWGANYYSSLQLSNVTISILADANTLFTNETVSEQGVWGTSQYQASYATWGTPMQDNGNYAAKGVSGKIDLGIDTKTNTIYYLPVSNSYRWNGYQSGNASMNDGSFVAPLSRVINPEAFLVYKPLMGRVRYINKDGSGNKGTYYFNGSGNVGTWVAHYVPDRTKYTYNSGLAADQAPIIDIGKVYMNGDGNVGIYMAKSTSRPHQNGIFMGTIPIDFQIGTSLNGAAGVTQIAAGNTDGDAGHASGNAALYVDSGQRAELTATNGYFPATTNLVTHAATQYFAGGMGAGVQIGYPDLTSAAHAIQPLTITDFNIVFGKYSKNNYGVIARNGSVVVINPSQATITDGQTAATADADRADGTIYGFAEAVWFNPRLSDAQRAPDDGAVHTDGRSVIDGTSGQKYVPQYGSEIRFTKPIALGSKNAVAVFANEGGKIQCQSITIYGAGSTGAFARGARKWSLSTLETNAAIGGGTTAKSVITVNGNITLTNGNANKGAVAMSDGSVGDGATLTVSGNLTVNGLGAFAEGVNSTLTVSGAGSTLTSGADGSLVSKNGATLRFGGGTITHSVANQLPFYSDGTTNSHLTFTGATTVNISDGVMFYGDTTDFAAAAGGTTTYNGMSNVTVNLTNHGVNLGVFKDIDVTWDGTTTYSAGLATIPKVAAINGVLTYWYRSSLDGGKMTIATNVDRDQISSGSTKRDGFNDIVMERKQVTLNSPYTITSTAGHGMLLGSNATANSNTESGYTVKGTIDIADGAAATVATYVSYGHIVVESGGKIKVAKGVGAYGINGSKIENKAGGTIEVGDSTAADPGIGILALATNLSGTPDAYGKNSGKAGKWIEIINNGAITFLDADKEYAIGIFADVNRAGVAQADVTISNQAAITVGDNGKGIVLRSSLGNGGLLTLKDSGTGMDIKVGKNGIGVYAEKSRITFDGNYGIEVQEGGVALQTKAGTAVATTAAADKLTVDYKGTAGTGNTAIGIAFEGTAAGDTITNALNLEVKNTNNAETITGIYGTGLGTISNSGNIDAKSTGAYGILTKGVNVTNTGTITVGDSAAPVSGAVGVYANDANVTTAGDKIIVQGNGNGASNIYPIGVYAKSSAALAALKTISVTAGAGAMNVSGKNGIGIYIEDLAVNKLQLTNASDITLADSAAKADRRFGLFLSGTAAANTTAGTITVGQNNIGVYNKNSTLTQTAAGVLDVTNAAAGAENIGIHNVADGGSFSFTNAGTVTVSGIKNIGISAATSGTDAGAVALGVTSAITVAATSQADGDIPIGIYGKGNYITVSGTAGNTLTAGPNAIGIYLDGDGTTTTAGSFSAGLSSSAGGKTAIGAYYKNGSFANTGLLTVTSTGTAVDGSGNPIRPIGFFYGTGSTKNVSDVAIAIGSDEALGIYGKSLTPFAQSGNIILNAESIGAYFADSDVTQSGNVTINPAAVGGYGLYFKGGTSEITSAATVSAGAQDSIGAIITGAAALLTNKGTVSASGQGSIGVYTEQGGVFVNDTGATLSATLAAAGALPGATGAFSDHGEIENKGNVATSYIGLYGKNSAKVTQTAGTVTVNAGIGVLAEGAGTTADLNGGTIVSTAATTVTGAYGTSGGKITLDGAGIGLGANGIGIYLDSADGKFVSGNISVGAQGTGIYAKQSTLEFASYSGTLTLGNKGIGIYSDDNTITISGAPTIAVSYTSGSNDKGVGIYYKGTTAVTNALEIIHTGNNLVHIFADGVDVTNTANQTLDAKGIGIFADNGTTVSNQATLTLNGDEAIGIYLANTTATGTTTLTDIGTINGTPVSGVGKVGVYVLDGDITGTADYTFAIDGGVGLYLVNNVVSYSGEIKLTANSTATNRAIGIYVSDTISGNIANNMSITGDNAIGVYLATDGVSSGADITYNGELKITSTGSTLADRGVGVVLDEYSKFTLGTLGKIEIGGNNNIGFYVKRGATLSVAGGQVTNTVDGVFAYIVDGTLHFTAGSPININYANIIVSGALGSIINDTNINVGTKGLQASNNASVVNSTTGVINATVDEGKALVGTSNATVTNDGVINLAGDKSVAIYVEGGAAATTGGKVTVGEKSVAYYAGKDASSIGGSIQVTNTGQTTVGKGGTVMYGAGGTISWNEGNIVLLDETTALTLSDSASVVDFNGHSVTTGEKGVGVFVTGTGDFSPATVLNLPKISAGKEATAVYLGNGVNFTNSVPIDILGESGIGILTTDNGNITYGGTITSIALTAKGIISTGTGNIRNDGTVKLTGNSAIGIYGENSGAILNSATGAVQIGQGTAAKAAVALYGKDVGTVDNDGTITIDRNAVGIYGKNAVITNTGTIQNAGGHNTGIYGEGGSATNTGTITLGETSNGVFVKNGTSLTNTGNITVGDEKSAGLYGAGTTPVDHLGGTIKVGKNAVGVASESGNLNVAAAAAIVTGQGSTAIYTETGAATNNANLNLADYSIGMYGKAGSIVNNATITTGNSLITATSQQISVGMVTGTIDAMNVASGGGLMVNNGTINVPTDHSVAMIAYNTTGNGVNNGVINVSGDESYGMEASSGATITNKGTIKASGEGARAMAGTAGAIVVNDYGARLEATGAGAEGIFVGNHATAINHGTIYVNGNGAIGIHFGQGADAGTLINDGVIQVVNGVDIVDNGATTVNVGNITIEDNGPTITVGDVVYDAPTLINGGYIEYVNGALDFGTVKIASTEGHIGTISAQSFAKGNFIVLPNATQGNNRPVNVIQYLKGIQNMPNNGTIKAISHSVSWLADLQMDPNDPNIARIVMVKIPYAELTKDTKAYEFGKGLDEIYVPAYDTELQMFDAIDMISDKDELGETFDMELRGNVYANIQHRMEDIREIFDMATEQLRHDRLYSKDSLKVGVIGQGGKFTDKNPAIEDYEYKTAGFMLMKEYDHRRYGRKSSWNLGYAYTNFDFDFGSQEKVHSLTAGLGYEDFVGESRRLKYHGRLELTANRHSMDRKIHLSNGTWSDEGKYWSWTAMLKNKLRYEIPPGRSGRVKGGVFASLNLGYGKFEDISETGDGIRLEIKGEDQLILRPGVGADVTFAKHGKRGRLSLTGKISAEYEFGKVYDGPNQAKIKGTTADWYDLEEPKKLRGIFKAGAELKYETRSGHSVGFEVVREEGSRRNTRYGVNFTYRFDQ